MGNGRKSKKRKKVTKKELTKLLAHKDLVIESKEIITHKCMILGAMLYSKDPENILFKHGKGTLFQELEVEGFKAIAKEEFKTEDELDEEIEDFVDKAVQYNPETNELDEVESNSVFDSAKNDPRENL